MGADCVMYALVVREHKEWVETYGVTFDDAKRNVRRDNEDVVRVEEVRFEKPDLEE